MKQHTGIVREDKTGPIATGWARPMTQSPTATWEHIIKLGLQAMYLLKIPSYSCNQVGDLSVTDSASIL